jgi:hypothetical protein
VERCTSVGAIKGVVAGRVRWPRWSVRSLWVPRILSPDHAISTSCCEIAKLISRVPGLLPLGRPTAGSGVGRSSVA